MSYLLQEACWLVDLPLAQREVLRCLCRYATNEGADAFPSVATVALLTRRHRSTVLKALAALRAADIIEVTKAAGPHAPAHYAIHIDRAPLLQQLDEAVQLRLPEVGSSYATPAASRGRTGRRRGRTRRRQGSSQATRSGPPIQSDDPVSPDLQRLQSWDDVQRHLERRLDA